MKLHNKIIYNKTSISYNIFTKNNIQSLFLNYLSVYEIEKLMKQNPLIFQQITFIHLVITHPEFRNQKSGTHALNYFKQLCPTYPIVLFCENNYVNFNLVQWYKSLGFIEIYSNLEATLMIIA